MNISSPIVSVIIPVYNAAPYITETLESVFASTYTNIEVICIDDCSPDNAVEIIEKYQRENKHDLKIIRLDQNAGPSKARNVGISESQGEYILPLDADDKIDPTYIEKGVTHFQKNPETAVFYCQASMFGKINEPCFFPPYDPKEILVRNMVFVTALFKKVDWKRYGGFNENMRQGLEDWDFWLYFVEDNRIFYQSEETLFFYRKIETSRSDSAHKHSDLLRKQIKKNHPNLYKFTNIYNNPAALKERIKDIRKSIIQIRIKKDSCLIRLFGKTLYSK